MAITFRAVIEVLGKPKEHIEKALAGYIQQLKESKDFQLLSEELAEAKKREEGEMWAAFAELELKTDKLQNLTSFCFDFMPSMIEIIEPREIRLQDTDLNELMNDLQGKLHQVDMVAKSVKMENDIYKRNLAHILKNYITLLLNKQPLTSLQLSNLTGVVKEKIEDFLDKLIDDGVVDLEGEKYSLKH